MGSTGATEVVRAEGFGLAEMRQALVEAGAPFVALLRALDPADGARQVPHLDWSVSETAVHVLTVIRRGLGDQRRADSVDGLATLNQQAIDETDARAPGEVGALLEEDLARYAELLASLPAETVEGLVIDLHAGVRSDLQTGVSYQLVEFLVHGWDIATATGRPWTMAPHLVSLAARAVLPAVRPWVIDEVLEGPARSTRITFPAAPWTIEASTGGGTWSVRTTARADDDPEVDPAEMLLAVAARVAATDPTLKALAGWFRAI